MSRRSAGYGGTGDVEISARERNSSPRHRKERAAQPLPPRDSNTRRYARLRGRAIRTRCIESCSCRTAQSAPTGRVAAAPPTYTAAYAAYSSNHFDRNQRVILNDAVGDVHSREHPAENSVAAV